MKQSGETAGPLVSPSIKSPHTSQTDRTLPDTEGSARIPSGLVRGAAGTGLGAPDG